MIQPLTASLVVNVMSRTGRPAGSPESFVRFHGLWHAPSATAPGVSSPSTFGPRAREETIRDPAR